jgi:hypothetical protein
MELLQADSVPWPSPFISGALAAIDEAAAAGEPLSPLAASLVSAATPAQPAATECSHHTGSEA